VEARRIDDGEFRGHLRAGQLQRAAAWLVEQHAHEVLALCRAMVRDATAAEDLAQDAFGRAFAGLPQFRGEASARTWLLTIARHGCIDHLRARRRNPWAGVAGDPADPDEVADDAPLPPDLLDRHDEVAAALAELSEGERALVVLRYAHGFEYAELAETFGLREGTVRMRLSRALGRMRERLAGAPCFAAALASEPCAEEAAAPQRARAARRLAAAVVPFGGAAPALPRRAPPAPAAAPAPAAPGGLAGAAGGAATFAAAAASAFAGVLLALEPAVPAGWRNRLLAAAQAV
jgi:RNA polymerase sigma-70 factor (ECF subfamily)